MDHPDFDKESHYGNFEASSHDFNLSGGSDIDKVIDGSDTKSISGSVKNAFLPPKRKCKKSVSNFVRLSTPYHRVPTPYPRPSRTSITSAAATSRLNEGIHSYLDKAIDRPVTQQGVTGLKTASSTLSDGPRAIYDKTYYKGLLHNKISEVNAETHRLNSESNELESEHNAHSAYESEIRVKIRQLEILHETMENYNYLLDSNSKSDNQVNFMRETEMIELQKDEKKKQLELLFNRKRMAKRDVEEEDKKIQEERGNFETLIESMEPKVKERYYCLQSLISDLQVEMDRLQRELERLEQKKSELEPQLMECDGHLGNRAVALYLKWVDYQNKRAELVKQINFMDSSEDPRQGLIFEANKEKQEIVALEEKILSTSQEIKNLKAEQGPNDAEETKEQGMYKDDVEFHTRFIELRKKEKEMDQFLSCFEESKAEKAEQINTLEAEIFKCLEKLSRNANILQTLPQLRYNRVNPVEEMCHKQDELSKVKFTSEVLSYKNDALNKQLENFDRLEAKFGDELESLEEQGRNLNSELSRISDKDGIKQNALDRYSNAKSEAQQAQRLYELDSRQLDGLKRQHDDLQKSLSENEVHNDLVNMEKRLEEIKYAIVLKEEECLKKTSEEDYIGYKQDALIKLKAYNEYLLSSHYC